MNSKLPDSHTVDVESSTSVITQVCEPILAQIRANSYSAEDVFAIHLAFEEAFTNAVKHGNKMDPTKHVQINYCVDPEKVEICITDEGSGFDPTKVPDPRSGHNLYKPEGRGLLLIRSYMDVVEYNQKGNSLRMVRYKEKPPLKAPELGLKV